MTGYCPDTNRTCDKDCKCDKDEITWEKLQDNRMGYKDFDRRGKHAV